jgi:hypothetical protein
MSNPRRQIFVPAAFAGFVIWSAAAIRPAVADQSATPWTPVAGAASDCAVACDCAVASRRFDFHPQLPAAAPQRARAPGGAWLRPLVAAPCGRAVIARDV